MSDSANAAEHDHPPTANPSVGQRHEYYVIHGTFPHSAAELAAAAKLHVGPPTSTSSHTSSSSSSSGAAEHNQATHSTDLMALIHEAGFTGNAANIMYAIVMAESSGNAAAHNTNASTGDNSYGLAQINMLGSMGPARLREFGLKSYNDLFDPLTNLRVAYIMSGHGTHFGDWSTYNRGDYLQYMGQTGAHITNAGAGGSTSPFSASSSGTALGAGDYKGALGALAGILESVPSLKSILDKAIKTDMPIADFINAVQSSVWYKTHSDTFKTMFSQKYADPAEYKRQFDAEYQHVAASAKSMGVTLTGSELAAITHNALWSGQDDATVQRAIAGHYTLTGGVQRGTAASTTEQLKQLAAQYGVPVTNSWLQKFTTTILEGTNNIDGARADLISQAQSTYPSISKELAAGKTVADVAQPYVAQMSQTLEIPDQQIQMTDPTIKKALQFRPPAAAGAAQAAPQLMPLYQFENGLRQDPRWDKTNNAKQEAYGMLHNLGQSFGFDS